MAAHLNHHLAALLQAWDARARAAHPADAMLINRHARELRDVIALALPHTGATPCDGILRGNADLLPASHTYLAPQHGWASA